MGCFGGPREWQQGVPWSHLPVGCWTWEGQGPAVGRRLRAGVPGPLAGLPCPSLSETRMSMVRRPGGVQPQAGADGGGLSAKVGHQRGTFRFLLGLQCWFILVQSLGSEAEQTLLSHPFIGCGGRARAAGEQPRASLLGP